MAATNSAKNFNELFLHCMANLEAKVSTLNAQMEALPRTSGSIYALSTTIQLVHEEAEALKPQKLTHD